MHEREVAKMLLFYVRHGDPIYSPDDLTPLGLRQAEAIGRRLARYGLDEIYSSPMIRAQKTAQPAAELVKKPVTILDWTSESAAWEQLSVDSGKGYRTWFFAADEMKELLLSREVRRLGDDWYKHERFTGTTIPEGYLRVRTKTREFMKELGFEWDDEKGMYKNLGRANGKRVALFAHHGFGTCFLSNLLDIPYPQICEKTDITHTGLTVIYFDESREYVIPVILTLSDGGHLLADNLPENYNNIIRF